MPAASCSDCGGRILLAAQPDTVFGSPDAIVQRGVRRATKAVRQWVEEILDAVDGLDEPAAIKRAIDRAAKHFDRSAFAEAFGDSSLHGGMLGALDADYEAEEDDLVAPASFGAYVSARYHPILLDTAPRFTHRGIEEAAAAFERRAPVTRDVFDAMTDEARSEAFTVAGAASKRVVDNVKRELVRQVAKGAELRGFRKAVEARLESAGWTPRNPSHVETVFRTGVMQAYNGGRYQQQTQPTVLALRPLWQWISVADSRSRDAHKAAHRKILRADDPWWRLAYPPAGYNCRCRVRSLRHRKGLTVLRGADMPTPLPDPGWRGGRRKSFSVPGSDSKTRPRAKPQPKPKPKVPVPRRRRPKPPPSPAPKLAQEAQSLAKSFVVKQGKIAARTQRKVRRAAAEQIHATIDGVVDRKHVFADLLVVDDSKGGAGYMVMSGQMTEGKMAISSNTAAAARRGFRLLAEVDPLKSDYSIAELRDLDAVSTIIHEQLHSASAATGRTYRGLAKVVEEVTTELLARRTMRDMLPGLRQTPDFAKVVSAYNKEYINPLTDIVTDVAGVPFPAAQELLADAGVKSSLQRKTFFSSAEQHEEAFFDALALPKKQRQTIRARAAKEIEP